MRTTAVLLVFWYDKVPGARNTRDGDTGNEDNSSFARFFGTLKCRGHGVPEMVTPAMRTTAVLLGFLDNVIGNENNGVNEHNSSFARFFKLDKYAMFSFDERLGKGF